MVTTWEPIKLNIIGEELRDFCPSKAGINDEATLPRGGMVGTHSCGASMFCYRITDVYSVLVCHLCFFRIYIPNAVTTYGQLRKYLQEHIIHVRQGRHDGECACA